MAYQGKTEGMIKQEHHQCCRQRRATQATGISKATSPLQNHHYILRFTLDGIKILAMPQVHLKISQLTRQKETYTEAFR